MAENPPARTEEFARPSDTNADGLVTREAVNRAYIRLTQKPNSLNDSGETLKSEKFE